MEISVRRRLECISRHLLLQREANPVLLHPVLSESRALKREDAEPVVIGGMVLDIHAIPSIYTTPRTTTPGKVHYVAGGVARNVAECMSKLGTKLFMISAVGLDMAGNLLLEHWKSAALSIEGIQKHEDIKTATVCNIFDNGGELVAGVASVEAIEKFLAPEWIQLFKFNISIAPIVVVDANLNHTALETSCKLAAESNTPVWFEPVSVAKSRRIASVAKYISFASPNEDELIAMANALSYGSTFSAIEKEHGKNKCSIESLFGMLKPAIWVLLEKGIKVVVVTLGAEGVFLCSKGGPNFMRTDWKGTKPYRPSGQLYKIVTSSCPPTLHSGAMEPESSSFLFAVHFPTVPASVVRLTGAGDCLVGGTLASLCSGLDVMQSVAVGIGAAKAAVETQANVPSVFELAAIADDAKKVYSAAKVVFHQSMV